MRNLYSMTLKLSDGRMVNHNVLAPDPLVDGSEDSAVTKAKRKNLSSFGENGTLFGYTTVAEGILES